ncbi:hypothetical protein [Mycobacterium sp.]|jgi:hypothetical protein|uniref:hypothetical protein n=1 Tax=Mycobacterium sp. TaxID=1785 RepID=UPI00333F0F23|nr:3-oxoacyl-ACP reductase [Mycobacterium sp.]MCW2629074.1 3-oxoacyl-ACP reductase [Mycobacterium sp.]
MLEKCWAGDSSVVHPHDARAGVGGDSGHGASLVSAYRKLGYAVVANSRTITESDDTMVLTVPGDIGSGRWTAHRRRRP